MNPINIRLILILIFGVTTSMVQAQINDGLLIDLQFNGNLKSTVGTTEGLTLQPAVYAKGIEKKCLDLSSTAAQRHGVHLGKSRELNFGVKKNFSALVWIKTEKNAPVGQNIIGTRDGKDHPAGWNLASQKNGSWVCNLSDGKNSFEYAPTPTRQIINDGKWHQIGLTLHRTRNEARFYYDGKNVGIYNLRGLGSLNSKLGTWIGNNGPSKGSDKTDDSFNGFIDQTRLWNRVLTSKEIEDSYYLVHWTKRRIPDEKPVKDLKIMAWNIWHGGRSHGTDVGVQRVIDVIKESKADIILMQETYGSGAIISDSLNYYFYLISTNLSIMSRYPIGETYSSYDSFRCGAARIRVSKSQEIVASSLWIHYLPSISKQIKDGTTPKKLIAEEMKTRGKEIIRILKDLKPIINASDNTPVIIGGDFNSPSHLDWTEETKTRETHSNLVVEWPVSNSIIDAGFIDSYREYFPDPSTHYIRTWSPAFPESHQKRIDYVYYKSKNLRAVSGDMIDSHTVRFPSDHAAYMTTLRYE